MKKSNLKSKAVKMLPPVRLTKGQRAWLDAESARSGHALSVIIRDLVQAKIDGGNDE